MFSAHNPPLAPVRFCDGFVLYHRCTIPPNHLCKIFIQEQPPRRRLLFGEAFRVREEFYRAKFHASNCTPFTTALSINSYPENQNAPGVAARLVGGRKL